MKNNKKAGKKAAKAGVKASKAEAKAVKKRLEISAGAALYSEISVGGDVHTSASVSVQKKGKGSDLVVKALSEEQLRRLLPVVSKEVFITLTQDKRPIKAGLLKFVREGLWETAIKVLAGLIVGYLLIKFGFK